MIVSGKNDYAFLSLKSNAFDLSDRGVAGRATPAGLDAFVYTAEAGSAWTLIYPQYSVAVPLPDPISVPIALALPRGDRDWAGYVNTWIELNKQDGTLEAFYDHWILGGAAKQKEPRWSVIRDVLGWID